MSLFANMRPMVHIAHLRNRFKSINTFVESYELIWREINHLLFVIKWSVFVIHRVPFIKRCFVPSLVEIDPMVEIGQVGLEKKMKMQTVYRQKDNRQSLKT